MHKRARTDWRTAKTPHLRTFAKTMRHAPTEAEQKLGLLLRNRRFVGYKFRRQLPVGQYIVDFACLSAKLIVEADGSQHAESATDVTRDAYLRSQGFRLLRLRNDHIVTRPDDILDVIWTALHATPETP
ncbi:endonuclease domain-containing protein [Devosia ginsengisoli]|uniref:Endonuclease domain-containing protein n=1 Tax=Devosia ginsengisoli TaxID=400770 RepID=A0A5B8LQH2_9HYPH|nr:endonuclease domain-containing protein [Devosia ginsengisoli]QDZ09702.1 endonuclease domain-containing protein [Devosia ginsengisoli]